MTKYIPTTNDVREAYRGTILATDKPGVFELIDPAQADEEFDLWLDHLKHNQWASTFNKGHNEGRLAERERIIRLLNRCDVKVFGRLVYSGDRTELIDLIVGKN